MGLDMHLTKRFYIGGRHDGEMTGEVRIVRGDGKSIAFNPQEITEIVLHVAYWRNATAINKWFVDNCFDDDDGTNEVWLPIDRLEELFDVCCEVLEDHSKARELLPATDSRHAYDEDYFEDLEYTKKTLEKLLAEEEVDGFPVDYYYRASW